MKRTMCLLLCAVMLLSLCACKVDTGKSEEKATLQVGFGRADVTPFGNVPLAGYSARTSQGVLDKIYVTCVAITDAQGNTALIFTEDSLGNYREQVQRAFQAASKVTGVPVENMTLSGTHTHSAPRANDIIGWEAKVAQAAKEAMEDRAPAKIKAGSTQIPGMNFVRHYVMKDGSIQGDNFGDPRYNIISHTTEADNQMQLIRFVRKEKKDVLMINWQAHPKVASTNTTLDGKATRNMISADFIGFCRTYTEEADKDCLVAYYSGASGNLNPISYISDNMDNCPTEVRTYGKKLSDYVLEAMSGLQSMEPGLIKTQVKDHPVKKADGTDGVLNLSAITMGNIAFASVPFEMFDTNGMQIKDGSSCDITFVLSCANGRSSYIPAKYAWEYNPDNPKLTPYEVTACSFEAGTAESVAQALIEMLKAQ